MNKTFEGKNNIVEAQISAYAYINNLEVVSVLTLDANKDKNTCLVGVTFKKMEVA